MSAEGVEVRLSPSQASALRDLCRRHGVRRLELFGSSTQAPQPPSPQSDLDFLVEFLPLPEGSHADAYFALLEDLQALFSRPVDLVMTKAITNPYFLAAINQQRVELYAA